MKKIAFLLMILFALGIFSSTSLAKEENLLKNGSFETLSQAEKDYSPQEWGSESWVKSEPGQDPLSTADNTFYQTTATVFDLIKENAKKGKNCILIQNIKPDDARVAQKVTVSPNTLYRLSGWIKAEKIQTAEIGATLSIENTFVYTKSVFDTEGRWEYVEMYGRTASGQKEMTIFCRVGGYGCEVMGKAWFDDICLEKVDTAPNGTDVQNFQPNAPEEEPDDGNKPNNENKSTGVGSPDYMRSMMYAFSLLFIALWIFIYNRNLSKKSLRHITEYKNIFMLALTLAFAFRIILAYTIVGFSGDLYYFLKWGSESAKLFPFNLGTFYSNPLGTDAALENMCDYPPLAIWTFMIPGAITNLFGITYGNPTANMLTKLPAIAAELVLAYILFNFICKRWNAKIAFYVATFAVLFNPVFFMDSAIWSQVDTILALGIFLTFYYMMEKRLVATAISFILTFLFKPQIAITAPIVILGALYVLYAKYGNKDIAESFTKKFAARNNAMWHDAWRQMIYVFSKGKKEIGKAFAWMIGTFVVVILPFAAGRPLNWIITLYESTLTKYQLSSLNAFNIYSLTGSNYCRQEEAWIWGTAEKGSGFVGRMNGAAKTNLPLLSWSYETWGTIFVVLLCISAVILFITALRKWKGEVLKLTPLLGAFIIIGFYMLSVRVHERYIFPAIALLILAYVLIRDKRILYCAIGFSVMDFLNMGKVLLESDRILGNKGINGFELGYTAFSALMFGLFVVFIRILVDIVKKKRLVLEDDADVEITLSDIKKTKQPIVTAHEEPNALARLHAPREKTRFTKLDAWLVAGLMLFYAVLAFINLGSTNVPMKYWQEKSGQQYAYTVDMGDVKEIKTIWYYGGVRQGSTEIAYSLDNIQYQPLKGTSTGESGLNETGRLSVDEGEKYNWKKASIYDSGQNDQNSKLPRMRYLKFSGFGSEFMLNEVVLLDKNDAVVPIDESKIQALEGDLKQNNNFLNIFNEANTLPEIPSFMNSMYFDEIYHARTAFEHLNGMNVYEITHPPLGKIIISAGIAIFGMNPFGWRIMGALFGILMIPLMFALGKSIFKKTNLAFFATFLLTFDFMHFAQTRISTIDVYAVFFIILMYWAMYEYYKTNFNRDGLKATLIPLMFAGVAFGLGAASKWTCIYAGAGLAILFAITVYQRFNEYFYAKKHIGTSKGADSALLSKIRTNFSKNMWVTIGVAALFFIVIPAIIYSLAYLPYPRDDKSPLGLINVVLDNQNYMFNYHSALTATHPFSSEWYEWPFVWRPIWFYAGSNLPTGQVSSIASFGNPVVWISGFIAVFWIIAHAYKKSYIQRQAIWFILIGFIAQIGPWIFVTRATFIYHYFAAVPFTILCIVYFLSAYLDKNPHNKRNVYIFLGVVALLFVLYYPAISGMVVSGDYARWLQLHPNWYFFSIAK